MKDEIARLKKLVDKDPKSTMFVPLAEEYRKQERLDEAIETLKQGLMNQPLYTTGRVALGKVLMERSMFEEAREEFERVLDAMPDNIVARKKLAEIYTRLGRADLAEEHDQFVSGLTPPASSRKAVVDEGSSGSDSLGEDDSVIRSPVNPDYAQDNSDEGKLDHGDLYLEVDATVPEAGTGSAEEGIRSKADDGDETLDDVIEIATESMADVYISQNLYQKAMEVLRKLEHQSPDNRSVRQKIEDLRMLMNISKRGGAS